MLTRTILIFLINIFSIITAFSQIDMEYQFSNDSLAIDASHKTYEEYQSKRKFKNHSFAKEKVLILEEKEQIDFDTYILNLREGLYDDNYKIIIIKDPLKINTLGYKIENYTTIILLQKKD